ncbi:hypothetical protein A4X09_0g1505 [Tilletia walkeri]|uniref:Uncharacterized protein n=1 Tax=Tilletia walkeri TaxID=117179 RepID=A0A8X7NF48_9BASI|nr:hypothetical protein A4X09_0g1505 [Tilletia walkeri]
MALAVEAKAKAKGPRMAVTLPSCGSDICQVKWSRGQSVVIEWNNAPLGDVNISLEPDGDPSLQSYPISKSVNGKNLKNKCKKKKKNATSCGRYVWHVPSNIPGGSYTVRIRSKKDNSVVYTDTIVIAKVKPNKPKPSKPGKPGKSTTTQSSTLTTSITSSSAPTTTGISSSFAADPAPTTSSPSAGSDDEDDDDSGDESDDDDDAAPSATDSASGATITASVAVPDETVTPPSASVSATMMSGGST